MVSFFAFVSALFVWDAIYKVVRIRRNDLCTTPTLLAADAALNAVLGVVGLTLLFVVK